jgi:hypothetical protein
VDSHFKGWAKPGPIPPGASSPPEIPADEIQRSNNLLKVVDLNSEPCTLHYRLRFTDRDGRPEAYDPAIKNGGTT